MGARIPPTSHTNQAAADPVHPIHPVKAGLAGIASIAVACFSTYRASQGRNYSPFTLKFEESPVPFFLVFLGANLVSYTISILWNARKGKQ